LLPEVPTIAEAGVSGFDWPIWYGVWVPAGTPAGVVDKLAKDIARSLATPDMRDWLAKHGADPMIMTQPEFARFVLSESEGGPYHQSRRDQTSRRSVSRPESYVVNG